MLRFEFSIPIVQRMIAILAHTFVAHHCFDAELQEEQEGDGGGEVSGGVSSSIRQLSRQTTETSTDS